MSVAEKLTLIVTCTDRKSAQPVEGLRVGNLPSAHLKDRAIQWRNALAKERSRICLRELYQGDAWTQALKLEYSARRAGFDPTLVVASAGLGLVDADEEWPAYAATFSPRHADSIGSGPKENRDWWRLMTDGQTNFTEQTAGQTLLVLSETYSAAMAADVSTLENREDVVVFGGSPEVPDHLRIPADRGLRSALGGTTGSLNLRTAVAWIESLSAPTLVAQRDHIEWRNWVQGTRKLEAYNRTVMSDADILSFLRDIRRVQPEISKSRALRVLRDSGSACEQKRFGGLFSIATKEEK
ncbi:hypothetical protein QFZ30_003066 [Arthrobacter pascens]|uniref:hypothetical protein n=1 Tax=Arthrobacter pascens TaxID=1677 RepID=UPI00278E938C|nr:hypothetical protein [Arthrobacter pascens]MDQ0679684.1 hypothetical protein [Arthrobacter pascens]